MGGALILLSVASATLLWADLRNSYIWIVLGVLASITGIILSAFGLARAKQAEAAGNPNSGRGIAMAGLIIGIIMTVLGTLFFREKAAVDIAPARIRETLEKARMFGLDQAYLEACL